MSKPVLLLLHGWGFSRDIFCKKPEEYTTVTPNLPGFGDGPRWPKYTLDGVCDYCVSLMPQQFHIMGWSMGGTVACAIVERYPERVLSLQTLACNPKFVADAHWPGVVSEQLVHLQDLLATSAMLGLRQFYAMLAPNRKVFHSWCTQALHSRPDINALKAGLTWLGECDYRAIYHDKTIKQQHWLAASDPLVPDLRAYVNAHIIPETTHCSILEFL